MHLHRANAKANIVSYYYPTQCESHTEFPKNPRKSEISCYYAFAFAHCKCTKRLELTLVVGTIFDSFGTQNAYFIYYFALN